MARQPASSVRRRSDAAKDPSTPSLAYKAMAGDWWLISTVLAGTGAMRAAGKTLLPKHEGESDPRYKDRLLSSTLTNYTLLTLDYWVGKPFTKPVQFTKDSDADIVALGDDINMCGDNMTVVCKDWFTKGLSKQVAYCLVEFPTVPQKEDGSPISLADQKALNLRPYWCIMPAEAVVAARKDRINGEDQFTHVRFYDNETYYDGFEEKLRPRIREFNRTQTSDDRSKDVVTQTVWELKDKEWIKGATTTSTQPFIPLVEFNTGKMELLDLAYLNVTHFQSSSDQRNCLTTARFPILAAKGVDKDTVITIGPYAYLAATDPNSEYYYVEHTGSALAAGQADLDSLVADMSLYGAEMLKKRPDRQTATAAVIDTAQSTAPLQVHVYSFISAVDQALYYTKLWMEKPEETIAKVEINTDFAMSKEASAQVDTLFKLRAAGDISREQFLKGLIDAKAVPEGFNVQENETQLTKEADAKAQAAADAAKKLAAAVPPVKPTVPAAA